MLPTSDDDESDSSDGSSQNENKEGKRDSDDSVTDDESYGEKRKSTAPARKFPTVGCPHSCKCLRNGKWVLHRQISKKNLKAHVHNLKNCHPNCSATCTWAIFEASKANGAKIPLCNPFRENKAADTPLVPELPSKVISALLSETTNILKNQVDEEKTDDEEEHKSNEKTDDEEEHKPNEKTDDEEEHKSNASVEQQRHPRSSSAAAVGVKRSVKLRSIMKRTCDESHGHQHMTTTAAAASGGRAQPLEDTIQTISGVKRSGPENNEGDHPAKRSNQLDKMPDGLSERAKCCFFRVQWYKMTATPETGGFMKMPQGMSSQEKFIFYEYLAAMQAGELVEDDGDNSHDEEIPTSIGTERRFEKMPNRLSEGGQRCFFRMQWYRFSGQNPESDSYITMPKGMSPEEKFAFYEYLAAMQSGELEK